MEKKFREWSLRVFGGASNLLPYSCPHLIYLVTEKETERRKLFLLNSPRAQPGASESEPTTPEVSSSEPKSPPEASSSMSQKPPKAASSKVVSIEAAPSQTSSSQPSVSDELTIQQPIKPPPLPPVQAPTLQAAATSGPPQSTSTPTPVISVSDGLASQQSITPPPLPVQAPTLQAVATSGPPQDTSTPTPVIPVSHISTDPSTVTGPPNEDMLLVATAIGVHQLLSQVAAASSVVQPSPTTASESLDVQPSQLFINPSELVVEPQVVIRPPQSAPGPRSHTPSEGLAVIPADSVIPPIPPQLLVHGNTASSRPTPKVPYRTRSPAATPSQKPRRNSIDGAPEMVVDLVDDDEVTVDIRDYISIASDDDESHVSSSQRTSDGLQELPPPSPDSQQVRAIVGRTAENENHSARTPPQLNVDEEDLPMWMVKKGQWAYLASTAGGTVWQALLEVYMKQERRLEFTEMASILTR